MSVCLQGLSLDEEGNKGGGFTETKGAQGRGEMGLEEGGDDGRVGGPRHQQPMREFGHHAVSGEMFKLRERNENLGALIICSHL